MSVFFCILVGVLRSAFCLSFVLLAFCPAPPFNRRGNHSSHKYWVEYCTKLYNHKLKPCKDASKNENTDIRQRTRSPGEHQYSNRRWRKSCESWRMENLNSLCVDNIPAEYGTDGIGWLNKVWSLLASTTSRHDFKDTVWTDGLSLTTLACSTSSQPWKHYCIHLVLKHREADLKF